MSTPMTRRAGMPSLYAELDVQRPRNRAPTEDPRTGSIGASPQLRGSIGPIRGAPIQAVSLGPRGLLARLRGEEDRPTYPRRRGPPRGGGRRGRGRPRRGLVPAGSRPSGCSYMWRWRSSPGWCCRWCCSWSAPRSRAARSPPAQAALTSGGNMITSTDTVLVLGTDQRPKGSKEPGADTSDKGSRTDTIMLWRIGGGVSRRLSIPRDTVRSIPGYGRTRSTPPMRSAARRWRSRPSRSSPA